MRTSTAMEHFAKAVEIAGGEIDDKGRLYVNNTATGRDCVIEEANIDCVIRMVSCYLKK